MPTISCPSCGLPNDRGAHRCHACGAALHPEIDERDVTLLDLEEQLSAARNRLADLDWRVQGTGWLALAAVLALVLLLGPAVGHPQLGRAVDCGSPIDAMQGGYEERYTATLWDGCAHGAARWAPVAAAAGIAGTVGVVLLAARAVRMRQATERALALQRAVRAIRSNEEAAVP
jgi:hypothetical protein